MALRPRCLQKLTFSRHLALSGRLLTGPWPFFRDFHTLALHTGARLIRSQEHTSAGSVGGMPESTGVAERLRSVGSPRRP